MDVRCTRCATEYEFDDALISERGTTVKCTNCGFQFKIFPPKAVAVAPERWLVRTSSGREVVFTSLRELQRGISDRRVGPEDLLSRGNAPARPLGSIPELEPFFAATSARASAKSPRTLHGVAPPPGALGPIGGAPAARPAAPFTPSAPAPAAAPAPHAPVAPPVKTHADAGPLSATLPAGATGPFSPKPADAARLTPPLATPASPAPGEPAASNEAPPATAEPMLSKTLPAAQASAPAAPKIEFTPPPPASVPRQAMPSYDEVEIGAFPDGTRRARSRWIAAVVILGVAGLFAATLGRQYLKRLTTRPVASAVAPEDDRVNRFLKEGNSLLQQGDLEAAKEQFVKAQALADKNPRVLAALARLETTRADITWLKLRLLDPQSTELVQSTHRDLGRRVGKAREAAEAAFKVEPEALEVVRARVDAFRLSGESAREWVGPIAAKPQDPENAYVLAALDLADPDPDLAKVIEHLKLAAASKEEHVRGRAALVYALGRSGRIPEAEAEVSQAEADPHPHPLLDELKSFVARIKATAADGGSPDAGAAATVDVSKLPALDTSPGPAAEGARAEPAGDFRQRLVQASTALRQGDLGRAEQLYQSVLNEQPGNTEALSGLADVARRRNDHATASRLYQRVLEQNPSYLPALIATADSKWASGDRKGAVVLYRRVLEQAGAGSEYGQRAAARIAEAGKEESAPAPSAKPPAGAPAETPTATAPPSPAPAPSIDTTDLPGFNQ